MGYDVHITRASDWTDSETNPITFAEWLAYVKSDSELRLDNAAEVTTEEGRFRFESPGLVVWTAWSQNGNDNNTGWMAHHKGRIVVKYPDAEFLRKMHAIVTHFGANVQGDD